MSEVKYTKCDAECCDRVTHAEPTPLAKAVAAASALLIAACAVLVPVAALLALLRLVDWLASGLF